MKILINILSILGVDTDVEQPRQQKTQVTRKTTYFDIKKRKSSVAVPYTYGQGDKKFAMFKDESLTRANMLDE